MGCQFAQKKQNGERMSSLPAKLLESSKAIGFRLVSTAVFGCGRKSFLNLTAIHSSAAVIFGGLLRTFCYIFNCKKGIAKWVED